MGFSKDVSGSNDASSNSKAMNWVVGRALCSNDTDDFEKNKWGNSGGFVTKQAKREVTDKVE